MKCPECGELMEEIKDLFGIERVTHYLCDPCLGLWQRVQCQRTDPTTVAEMAKLFSHSPQDSTGDKE
jgi:hypothetical protein